MTDRITITGKDFLADARRWLDWVEELAGKTDRMIEVARSKPGGLSQESNLILASDGSVWEPVWEPRRGYVRLEREAPFTAYRRTEDFIEGDERAYNGGSTPFEIGGRTFVAKGWDDPDADWSWSPPRHGGMGTLAYYEGARRSNEAGKLLGEALLAITPEALDEWAAAWAKYARIEGRRRDRRHIDGDWPALTAAFGLPAHREAPDNGSLHCYAHLLVDHAAGITDTGYAY